MTIRWNRLILATLAGAGVAACVVIENREAVATVFLATIVVLGWTFVIAYGFRSAWRSTAAGRGVMRLMLCLTVVCTQGMATILTSYSYPGRDLIRPVLLLAIALAIADLLLTLLHVQRTRHEIPEPKEEV